MKFNLQMLGLCRDMSIFKDYPPFHNQFGVFCLYLKRSLIKATFLECYRMFCHDDCKLFPLYKYMGKPRFICMQYRIIYTY